MKRQTILAMALAGAALPAAAQIDVPMHYLRVEVETPPTLSNLDEIPEDRGLAGARVGLQDNATTGQFLGHNYTLAETSVAPGDDPLPAAREALAGSRLLLIEAPAEALLAIADLPEAAGALLFNVAAEDDVLRGESCRANVLHAVSSYGMRADALGQFLLKKRWSDVAMIVGPQPQDA
ncbi:MAG: branched-chain amino acid ABC transporter substrate-binding protein, partial [Pseudomonadota bacterium]